MIRVAFKPTATIAQRQATVSREVGWCCLFALLGPCWSERPAGLRRWRAGGRLRRWRERQGALPKCCCLGLHFNLCFSMLLTCVFYSHSVSTLPQGKDIELLARGRHDPCVVPRAVPMVESMVALVLADQLLQHYAQVG